MQTTQLLVEIVVVGVGGAIAVILTACGVFGVDNVAAWIESTSSIATILPLLALIYVLGIVIDSLAKSLLAGWKKAIRRDNFKLSRVELEKVKQSLKTSQIEKHDKGFIYWLTRWFRQHLRWFGHLENSQIEEQDKEGEVKKTAFYHARTYVYQHADGLRSLYEYTRSTQRICRGWFLNSIFILISYVICRWTDLGSVASKEHIFIITVIAIFGLGCLYSWRRMIIGEAKRLSGQYPKVKERVKREIKAKS